MNFEWDEEKNRENQRKHGIPFEYAMLVFEDDFRLEEYDYRHDEEEDRYNIIGRVDEIIFVVCTYKDEDGRRYANLLSKYIMIKFAAGNIFTGEYVETDETNGVVSFGRPFTAFPTKMRFDYKYKCGTINRVGADWSEAYSDYIKKEVLDGLKGQPDTACIYIALGDWEPVTYVSERTGKSTVCPYLIRTRPSALHLFNVNDPHIIAYAQLSKGETVDTWTTETLTLNYRVTDRQPKYIIVVASSSKYGDYFAGGEGSLLKLDNVELLYE